MKKMAFLLGAVSLVALAAPASAGVLQLTVDVDGTSQTFSSTNGVLAVNGATVNGVSIFFSVSTNSLSPNTLTINTGNIINTNPTGSNPVSYQAVLSATDFVGPTTAITWSGSGTFLNAGGDTFDYNFYANGQNTLQSASLPLPAGTETIGNFFGTVAGGNDSVSGSGVGTCTGCTGAFSMTEEWSGTLKPGTFVVGRSQSMVGTAIPELSTWALLGLGFAMLGGVGWRKTRSGVSALA